MMNYWFRALKFWQTKSFRFVWQVQVNGAGKPFKTYLIADANQNTRSLTLSKDKPEDIHPQGPASAQMRKYARVASMRAIFEDNTTGDIWVPLHLPGAEADSLPAFYVLLSNSKPPLLSMLESQQKSSLVRISSQGSFTKRQTYEGKLPHEDLDQFNNIIDGIVKQTSDIPPSNDDEDSESVVHFDEPRRFAIQQVKRRIKTLKKSLKKESIHAASEVEATQLERHAKLLQTYAHLVKSDAIEVVLDPEVTGLDSQVIIAIDPDSSVGQNIERMFINAKKLRRAQVLGSQQINRVERNIAELENALDRLNKEDQFDAEGLLAELGIRKKSTVKVKGGRQEQAKPYRLFQSMETNIFVGKGAKENDELTKHAKGNDFWLHAVGVTGSHIIVDGSKFRSVDLPENLFRDAAILALHYSKIKGDMAGEVYYTRRSNIKKQKGMPVGLWNVDHSKSVFVRYDKAELDAVLKKVVP